MWFCSYVRVYVDSETRHAAASGPRLLATAKLTVKPKTKQIVKVKRNNTTVTVSDAPDDLYFGSETNNAVRIALRFC